MPRNNPHRARIVAEAVVSAYIHELAQSPAQSPRPPRGRGVVHTDLVVAPLPSPIRVRARNSSRFQAAFAPRRRRGATILSPPRGGAVW